MRFLLVALFDPIFFDFHKNGVHNSVSGDFDTIGDAERDNKHVFSDTARESALSGYTNFHCMTMSHFSLLLCGVGTLELTSTNVAHYVRRPASE